MRCRKEVVRHGLQWVASANCGSRARTGSFMASRLNSRAMKPLTRWARKTEVVEMTKSVQSETVSRLADEVSTATTVGAGPHLALRGCSSHQPTYRTVLSPFTRSPRSECKPCSPVTIIAQPDRFTATAIAVRKVIGFLMSLPPQPTDHRLGPSAIAGRRLNSELPYLIASIGSSEQSMLRRQPPTAANIS